MIKGATTAIDKKADKSTISPPHTAPTHTTPHQ